MLDTPVYNCSDSNIAIMSHLLSNGTISGEYTTVKDFDNIALHTTSVVYNYSTSLSATVDIAEHGM